MQTFFKDNQSDELILLFDGWGMDEKPYAQMESNRDVLFVFDYSNLYFDFNFSKYKKIHLITFSAGVFMSAHLCSTLPQFATKIAINGTLFPYDKEKGIPDETFSEMENITLENALDFRKKLIYDDSHITQFNKLQPNRTLQNSLDELSALKKIFALKTPSFEFDKIIIGENDLLIPYENQLKAWAGHKNTRILNGGHFLFYLFKSFDEIIDL